MQKAFSTKCGKYVYDTKAEAMESALKHFQSNQRNQRYKKHLRAYHCKRCGGYHLTKMERQ